MTVNRELKYNYYATPERVCSKIAALYSEDRFKTIIDLGCGDGRLSRAIRSTKGKEDCQILAYDIDNSHKRNFDHINEFKFLYHDVLNHHLNIELEKDYENENIVLVSNPPFSKISATEDLVHLLKRQNLIDSKSQYNKLRSELLFMARAIEGTPSGADLCFITPISLLTSKSYSHMRQTLVREHGLHTLQLYPSGTFDRTEVEVAVWYFKSAVGQAPYVSIEDVKSTRVTRHKPDDFLKKANYENVISNACSKTKRTLGDLELNFSRGRSCAKSLRQRGVLHIHTSDISRSHTKSISLDNSSEDAFSDKERLCGPGDILISRVGTRCLGKVTMIKSGSVPLSDCVIRIRAKSSVARQLFSYLSSEKAQHYFKDNAKGACAKIITYETLKSMPIVA